jgi:hypothetical protein
MLCCMAGLNNKTYKKKRIMKKLILTTVTAVLTFAASHAMASGGNMTLNVNGTVKYQNEGASYSKGSVGTHSFNEKSVYTLISNAVANASTISGGLISSTTLPANGYIAYSPGTYDYNGGVDGVFYVTNKAGYYYALSGLDADYNYYSWIELDTTIFYGDDSYLDLGYYYYYDSNTSDYNYFFNYIASYNYNTNSTSPSYGNASAAPVSAALLYIHDDPYLYDASIYPYLFTDYDYIVGSYNENALEIRGILTGNLKINDFDINSGSLSLTGTGDFIYNDYDTYGVVSSGAAHLQ